MRPRLYYPEDVLLRAVGPDDQRLLYRLQIERYESPIANVRGMAADEQPSWEQHLAFLARSPYAVHQMIVVEGRAVGVINLDHENVLGCFVLREHHGRGIGLSACYKLFQVCELPVIAFINPANRPSYRTVERLGMERVSADEQRLEFVLHRRPDDPFPARGSRAGRTNSSA